MADTYTLRPNPFITYRDPATGRWITVLTPPQAEGYPACLVPAPAPPQARHA